MFIATNRSIYEAAQDKPAAAVATDLGAQQTLAFWALIIAGFVVLAALGGGETWDGSYTLFKALDGGRPYVPHGRTIDVLLQGPCILLSHVTSNMVVLRFSYGVAYAALPVIALAVCWWITRQRSPWLFVWPVLGITLVTLPGQINLAAEANIPAQLFWPLLIAMLVGTSRAQLIAVGVLGLVILFAHPFAILVFGFGTAVAILLYFLRRPPPRDAIALDAVIVGLFIAAVIKYGVLRSAYDTGQVTPSLWGQHWQQSVVGRPLLMLLLTVLLCAALLALPYLRGSAVRTRLIYRSSACAVVLWCALIAVIGGGWAVDAVAWGGAIDYRTFIGPFSVLAMLVAVADALRRSTGHALPDVAELRLRCLAVLAAASAFALVIVLQAATWNALNGRLAGDLAAAPAACLPVEQMPWAAQTAFGHWSVTTLSLELQGRTPQRLVVSQPTCQAALLPTGIPVDGFDRIAYGGGWFRLQQLRAEVAGAR